MIGAPSTFQDTSFKVVSLGMALTMMLLYIISVYSVLETIFKLIFGFEYSLTIFRAWLLLEGIFIISTEFKYRILTDFSSSHLPTLDHERFEAVLKEFGSVDFVPEQFFEGWFFGCDYKHITVGDLKEWFSSMFFHKHTRNLSAKENNMISNALNEIVKKSCSVVQDDNDFISIKKIKLTTDHAWFIVRPMIFYIAIRLADKVGNFAYKSLGFKLGRIGNMGLIIHHRKGTSRLPPIVLFHGLGIGLCTYVPFVTGMIKRFQDRDIILFEMTSVTMRMDDRYILPKEFADYVALSLSRIVDRKCIFIGHSIGTASIRWIDMFHPEMIHSRIFIDPICFHLWSHDIAYNACYRWPTTSVLLY
jgi:hypothetical protein